VLVVVVGSTVHIAQKQRGGLPLAHGGPFEHGSPLHALALAGNGHVKGISPKSQCLVYWVNGKSGQGPVNELLLSSRNHRCCRFLRHDGTEPIM
jgi:hypothetical protein